MTFEDPKRHLALLTASDVEEIKQDARLPVNSTVVLDVLGVSPIHYTIRTRSYLIMTAVSLFPEATARVR